MRTAGHQAVCLTKNAFRVDRALQQLYFPTSTQRSFSASATWLNQEAYRLSALDDSPHTRNSISTSQSTLDDDSASPRPTDITNNAHQTPGDKKAEDFEAEKAEATQILVDALSKLRIKNRGYNSTLVRRSATLGHSPVRSVKDWSQSLPKDGIETPLRTWRLKKSPTPTNELVDESRSPLAVQQAHVPEADNANEPEDKKTGENNDVAEAQIAVESIQSLPRSLQEDQAAQSVLGTDYTASNILQSLDIETKSSTIRRLKIKNQTREKATKKVTKKARIASNSPLAQFRNCEPVFDILKGLECASTIKVSEAEGYRVWDYDGYPVHLPGKDKELYAHPQEYQEASLGSLMSTTPLERLNEEIQQFLLYIRPSEAEKLSKQRVVNDILHLVQQHGGQTLRTQLFGSGVSGYELCYSDIDIRLFLPHLESSLRNPGKRDKLLLTNKLELLVPILQKHGFEKVEFVHARYPLISARHRLSQVDVQLVASNSSSHVNEYVQEQMVTHPDLLAVYAVVRTYLSLRGLTDVYHGGLGAYTLIMMIIASLKICPGSNAGENLINFFRFYSSLDTSNSSIGIIPPRVDDKSSTPSLVSDDATLKENKFIVAKSRLSTRNREFPWYLCLQDPCDKNNDLGRRTFAWKHVQATFQNTLNMLESCINQTDKHYLILGPLIGPVHDTYAMTRQRVEQYALTIPKSYETIETNKGAEVTIKYTPNTKIPKTIIEKVISELSSNPGHPALKPPEGVEILLYPPFRKQVAAFIRANTHFLPMLLWDKADKSRMARAEESGPIPMRSARISSDWKEYYSKYPQAISSLPWFHQSQAQKEMRLDKPWDDNESATDNLLQLNPTNYSVHPRVLAKVHRDIDQSWDVNDAEKAFMMQPLQPLQQEVQDVGLTFDEIYPPPFMNTNLKSDKNRQSKPKYRNMKMSVGSVDYDEPDAGRVPTVRTLVFDSDNTAEKGASEGVKSSPQDLGDEPVSDEDVEELARKMNEVLGGSETKDISRVHELVDKGFTF